MVPARVSRRERERAQGHKAFVVWFTGLSGAGKSTLAANLERALFDQGLRTALLDGDGIRQGLSRDLGFSDADRVEQIRRVGHAARLMYESGLVVLVALISPFREARNEARALVDKGRFVEVFVDCPLDVCRTRDPKGLYGEVQAGRVEQFTGITSAYEPPRDPEIHLHTHRSSVRQELEQILDYLRDRDLLPEADEEDEGSDTALVGE